MRVRIKICGITSREIARYAVDAGADALGFMFYSESSRYLTIEQAVTIQQEIPPFVARVGVLVNPRKHYVDEVLKVVRPDYLQFHGDETPAYCASFGVPYIKAIRVSASTDLLALEKQYEDAVGLLLDSYVSGSYGGTGVSFAWHKAKYGGQKPLILAGGLTADNIQTAIVAASPYAVDVNSGVESGGVKDHAKIIRFCQNVRCSS